MVVSDVSIQPDLATVSYILYIHYITKTIMKIKLKHISILKSDSKLKLNSQNFFE